MRPQQAGDNIVITTIRDPPGFEHIESVLRNWGEQDLLPLFRAHQFDWNSFVQFHKLSPTLQHQVIPDVQRCNNLVRKIQNLPTIVSPLLSSPYNPEIMIQNGNPPPYSK